VGHASKYPQYLGKPLVDALDQLLSIRRIRRVKCDETKPICQRCIKVGLDCDGYQEEEHSRRWVPPSARNPSTSGQTSGETLRTNTGMSSAPTSVCRSPSRSIFKNDQEQRYFKLFSTQIVRQFTGLFSSEIWSRLVLQTSEVHPSIRHAIIALGALDPKIWRSPANTPEETSRRQFA
jgi:Fungal Zn(2)-Cys(6) binuclear cluster domain